MKKVKILLIVSIAFSLFLSSCANRAPSLTPEIDEPAQQEVEPTEFPVIENQDPLEVRFTQTPPSRLERVETPESAPVMGEVPSEILEEIFADLTERTGADRDDIKVIKAEAVVWNDGSLGCPKPGEFYIQILVAGYWVVVQVEGVEYDYRVTDSGNFKLCKGESIPLGKSPDIGYPDQNPPVLRITSKTNELLPPPGSDID